MKKNVKTKAAWLGDSNSAIRIAFFIPHDESDPSIGEEMVILFHRGVNIFIRETPNYYIQHIADTLGIEVNQVLEMASTLILELRHNLTAGDEKEIEYDFADWFSIFRIQ